MVKSNYPIPPDILERIDPEALSVPDLIGLVLVERGAPMTLEEIAERLEDLGVVRTVPSLRKTWHALRCLRKNRDGKLDLIRDEDEYSEWRHLQLKVHLHLRDDFIPGRGSRRPESPAVDEATAVSLEEMLRLPGSALPQTLSLRRRLALLAEACGGAVELERAVDLLAQSGTPITEEAVRSSVGYSGPVRFDEEGKLVLHPDESLREARRILRQRLSESAAAEEHSGDWEKRKEAEAEETRRWYGRAGKAVLRCLFAQSGFGAASVLDPDSRTFEDFTSAEELAGRLRDAELLLGIDPRSDLERLGLEPGERRFVDLSPPMKTVKLNRRGRQLRVTPELVIRSTLRLSNPLGDPSKLRRYLREGELGKVFRRLQADLKALWRLYEYGCLHGCVLLEWGFLHDSRGVGWNVGRLPRIDGLIEEAREKGHLLEAVLGRTAPGWEDPWSRAEQVRVVEYEWRHRPGEFVAEFPASGVRAMIPFGEVAALRRSSGESASAPPARTTRPGEGEAARDAFAWPDERDDQVS